MTPRAFDVYVRPRGRRPVKTDQKVTGKWPATVTHDGVTWFWAEADITAHTLTYTETAPIPPA